MAITQPKIRALEAHPIKQEGQDYILLRDPEGIAVEPALLTPAAYFLAMHFDGSASLLDLQAAFTRQFGEILPSEQLAGLIDGLDRGYFLDSPRFAERIREINDEYMDAAARPPFLAGLAYDKDPGRLRAEVASYFARSGAPGAIPAPRNDGPGLRGLISPHIDPNRGGAAYAHAYGELLTRERPELVVILGTSHYGLGGELFAATTKDYATPLGTVATDRDFVAQLAAKYEGDLVAGELAHRNEHSIEFQALFLAWALGTAGYQIVPILVGSFHQMVARGEAPAREPRVRSFLDAMRNALAADSRSTLILAGVDFAHVGRKFGDSFAADQEVAEWIAREDRALIENIERGDPDGFFATISKDRDARKICGLSPMYTQLELLRGRPGRLLMHDIAMEPQTESLVSFASLAID